MSYDNAPLPEGWIREVDPNTRHPFWVDTRAKPPRSIWVHPYEDERFLHEHPDVRDRFARERPGEAPPPYEPRRHSYAGSPSGSHPTVPGSNNELSTSHSQPGTPGAGQQNRGFFGKLKDKAIGTKEEREARRREEQRRQELYMQQHAEQRRLRQLVLQQRMSSPYAGGYGAYGPQYGQPFGQPMYAAPGGSPFGLGGRRPGRSGFGGGIGFPLLAGAAGGLLLGEMLDGPDYGGYDGGGFDGGGFDGGGFDGGGDF